MNTRWIIGGILLALLAACTGGAEEEAPTPTDPATDTSNAIVVTLGSSGLRESADDTTNRLTVPTLDPDVAWIPPAQPVTRENAFEMTYLGQLQPPDPPSSVTAVSFTTDGTEAVLMNNDYLIGFNLITGQLTFTNTRQGAVDVFYSPDKTEFFTVTDAGIGLVFDAQRGVVIDDFLAIEDFSGATAYDPFSGWLAVGGEDGTIKVWDPIERVSQVTYTAHNGRVSRLHFDPQGDRLFSAGDDQRVIAWDWQNRESLYTLEIGAPVVALAVNEQTNRLAVASIDFAMVYQETSGQFLYTLQYGRGGASDVLTFDPTGQYLLTGGNIPDMVVWDAATGQLAAQLPGVGGARTSAAFNPTGDLLLAAVINGPVTLYDMTQITAETIVRAEIEPGTERVVNLAFSPDGFSMLFFDAAGPAYVWGIPPE
jgi:WD40 repeat protein